MKIREALRLQEMKLSNVNISSVQCSRTTLIEMFRKCDEIAMDYVKASMISDSELDKFLYPQSSQPRILIIDPGFSAIQKDLQQHLNLNLKFLWDEYSKHALEGLSYSQFCERFRRWRQDNGN